jgi:hypothetical protein
VSSVVVAGSTYVAGTNHESDGDSTGTSIALARP